MSERLFDSLAQQLSIELDDIQGTTGRQAAVLVLITESEEPEILFTRRALNMRHHPGEICFPGGMQEPEDSGLLATALRETEEEIGLPASAIRVLGRLQKAHTHTGTPVTPFVATFNPAHPLTPSVAELDAIFRVPIADFLAGIQIREDHIERNGRKLSIPVYRYGDYEIWGFTAAVTARLLQLVQTIATLAR